MPREHTRCWCVPCIGRNELLSVVCDVNCTRCLSLTLTVLMHQAHDEKGDIKVCITESNTCFECVSKCFQVMDLGSTHGTFLDGKELKPNQPHVLVRGDEYL